MGRIRDRLNAIQERMPPPVKRATDIAVGVGYLAAASAIAVGGLSVYQDSGRSLDGGTASPDVFVNVEANQPSGFFARPIRVTMTNVGTTPATDLKFGVEGFQSITGGSLAAPIKELTGDCKASEGKADCGTLQPGQTVTFEATYDVMNVGPFGAYGKIETAERQVMLPNGDSKVDWA